MCAAYLLRLLPPIRFFITSGRRVTMDVVIFIFTERFSFGVFPVFPLTRTRTDGHANVYMVPMKYAAVGSNLRNNNRPPMLRLYYEQTD